jgi:hypothetical protein
MSRDFTVDAAKYLVYCLIIGVRVLANYSELPGLPVQRYSFARQLYLHAFKVDQNTSRKAN